MHVALNTCARECLCCIWSMSDTVGRAGAEGGNREGRWRGQGGQGTRALLLILLLLIVDTSRHIACEASVACWHGPPRWSVLLRTVATQHGHGKLPMAGGTRVGRCTAHEGCVRCAVRLELPDR